MVAIKFLGLIVTFYFFIILEAHGQNFYPARYGKRDESDSYQAKNLLETRRISRGENHDVGSRRMGFFISGGRFGKRGCTSNCYDEGSKEIIGEGFQNRQDRSERIRIPIRKNQFMMGSRFGKRREGQFGSAENIKAVDVRCHYQSLSDLFKCLDRNDNEAEDVLMDSNFSNDFQQ